MAEMTTEEPCSMMIIIDGQPMPKPRMTQRDRWAKRPCVLRYWEFVERVQAATKGKVDRVYATGEIQAIRFYLQRPKGLSRKRFQEMQGQPHQLARPDTDNLIKSILDSAFPKDDGFIWKIGSVEKRWDNGQGPRTELEV